MDILQTILNLREELNLHNHNYYVLDNPSISDFEFDQKLKQLQELENQNPQYFDENSPTQRVGGMDRKSPLQYIWEGGVGENSEVYVTTNM